MSRLGTRNWCSISPCERKFLQVCVYGVTSMMITTENFVDRKKKEKKEMNISRRSPILDS